MEDGIHQMKADSDITKAFERMQETVAYLALGFNYSEYVQQKQIAGEPIWALDGSLAHIDQKKTIDENEAEFVLSHCIDSVIEIEARVGSLSEPFGKPR